jgi:hypothetical protein
VLKSYDGKKNEPNYDDQLKFYAIFNNGSCSLITLCRKKYTIPVLEAKVLN